MKESVVVCSYDGESDRKAETVVYDGESGLVLETVVVRRRQW